MQTVLQQSQPAQGLGPLLLRPGTEPPGAVQPAGRQVCTCFNVSEASIVERLFGTPGDERRRMADLQGNLLCGTNCGSCIPELRRLLCSSACPQSAGA